MKMLFQKSIGLFLWTFIIRALIGRVRAFCPSCSPLSAGLQSSRHLASTGILRRASSPSPSPDQSSAPAAPTAPTTAEDEKSTSSNSSTDTVKDRLLHGMAKMEKVMTPEFFVESSPILKTFYTKLVKNIEIKKSQIPGAGLGLFAKKPIKANTIVSFYPAHALGIDSDDGQSSVFYALDPADQEYFSTQPSTQSAYLHCTDQPIFKRPNILRQQQEGEGDDTMPAVVYLDVNPQRPIPAGSSGWVSQMINDGATVTENTEQGVLDYYRQTAAAKNCIHIPFGPSPIMATVTTKKVKKGEELLTSYGGTYWLGVWLNVHGQEGVGITKAMQREIGASARDLTEAMQRVSVLYTNQLEALQEAFDKIVV